MPAPAETMLSASQCPVACNGTEEQLTELYEEILGIRPPRDLSHELPVIIGKALEQPCLDHIEYTTQHEITERQRKVFHPTLPVHATLDGYRAFDDAIVEFKAPGPHMVQKELITWYAPQVAVQMACRPAARGYLALLRGNSAIDLHELELGEAYLREMWTRIDSFLLCVRTMTPPVPPAPPLTPPERWRTIDLETCEVMPNWGKPMIQSLRLWADTKETHELHENAKRDVKLLLPEDVGKVMWGSITVKKAKNLAVTIREEEFSL